MVCVVVFTVGRGGGEAGGGGAGGWIHCLLWSREGFRVLEEARGLGVEGDGGLLMGRVDRVEVRTEVNGVVEWREVDRELANAKAGPIW